MKKEGREEIETTSSCYEEEFSIYYNIEEEVFYSILTKQRMWSSPASTTSSAFAEKTPYKDALILLYSTFTIEYL